jgi:hypothetical protein
MHHVCFLMLTYSVSFVAWTLVKDFLKDLNP